MNWMTIAAALVGGGIVQLIAALVGYYTKKKELDVQDDGSVRESLQKQVAGYQTERTGLVLEIDKLAERCGTIEANNRALSKENREQNEQIINMQKAHYEVEHRMQEEIDTLKKQVEELTMVKHAIEPQA